jgi:hypothetical protein
MSYSAWTASLRVLDQTGIADLAHVRSCVYSCCSLWWSAYAASIGVGKSGRNVSKGTLSAAEYFIAAPAGGLRPMQCFQATLRLTPIRFPSSSNVKPLSIRILFSAFMRRMFPQVDKFGK